jgi:hypothetical protein
MVGTIAPLVKGPKGQWTISVALYVAASTASGAFAGYLVGAAGLLFAPEPEVIKLVLGLAALTLGLLELAPGLPRLPSLGSSVPASWWTRFGPTLGASAYGAVLGIGISTIVPYASFYLLPVAAFLLGPAHGALIGASYGLARSLPVPLASLAIARGADASTAGDWALGPQRRTAKPTFAVLLVALGSLLLVPLAWDSLS